MSYARANHSFLTSRIESLLKLEVDAPKFLEALDSVAAFQMADVTNVLDSCDECEAGKEVQKSESLLKVREMNGAGSLRTRLEQHGVSLAEQFIASFDPLCDGLRRLEGTVDTLHQSCASVERDLETVRDSTSEYTKKLEDLRMQRDRLARRSQLVEDFLSKTRLTDAEVHTLSNAELSNEAQADAFFLCLERLNTIRKNETELSAGWTQNAGLELIARTSKLQNLAFERLFIWLRNVCISTHVSTSSQDTTDAWNIADGGGILGAKSPFQSKIVKRGLMFLRDRPAYFEECCVSVVSSVKETMRQRFVHALTVGGPGGSPPPIEYSVGDPHRYVGDMLAWVHTTVTSEIDALSTLFGGGSTATEGEGNENNEKQNSDFLRVSHLLPQAFDDMVRPLKVRINRVTHDLGDIIGCLEMCTLVCLYHDMIGMQLTEECTFMCGLDAIVTRCFSHFDELLKYESSKLLHSTTIYPSDLSVSQPVRSTVSIIASLCKVGAQVDTSRDGNEITKVHSRSTKTKNAREEKNKRLNVHAAVKTLVEAVQYVCQASSSSLSTVDRAIYIINNMEHLIASTESYAFTDKWSVAVTAEIDTWVDAIVGEYAKNILRECGLLEALAVAKSLGNETDASMDDKMAMALSEGMDPGTLGPCISSFVARLFQMEDQAELTYLSSPRTRERCRKEILNVLTAAYAALHDAINSKEAGYSADVAAQMLPHTPDQIYTVCDVGKGLDSHDGLDK